MLLALGIICVVVILAALIAKYVLQLEFRASFERLGYDLSGCYENWAAHRACPQKLPPSCDHQGRLSDCEVDSRELL